MIVHGIQQVGNLLAHVIHEWSYNQWEDQTQHSINETDARSIFLITQN